MKIVYSGHAQKRCRERGITEEEVEHVLNHPTYIKKSFEGRKVAVGETNNRIVKVVFVEGQSYIKIITVI